MSTKLNSGPQEYIGHSAPCCSLLYSTVWVLYGTVWYHAAAYCIVLYGYCMVLHGTMLQPTVWYCMVLYGTVWYCMVPCCSLLYGTVWYCMVLYGTMLQPRDVAPDCCQLFVEHDAAVACRGELCNTRPRSCCGTHRAARTVQARSRGQTKHQAANKPKAAKRCRRWLPSMRVWARTHASVCADGQQSAQYARRGGARERGGEGARDGMG